MRLMVLTLGTVALSLMSCAAGGEHLRAGERASPYYLQEHGPSARSFSAQKPATSFSAAPGHHSVIQTRQAVLAALDEVSRSTASLTASLRLLESGERSLATRVNGVFVRHAIYGVEQLPWLQGALRGAAGLAKNSAEVGDPDMELSLLRMAGPRLQAAMFGSLLLTAWVDFLNLTNLVIHQYPQYSAESLVRIMYRVQELIEPAMSALASLEPQQVEAAVVAMPELMGQLTREFDSLREGVRLAIERGGQIMLAAQLFEMITMASAMKLAMPRMPPAAPATLGVGLVMGSNGVMTGSRVVVSAEWVEQMRRLVQAGVLSVPVVSAAVRIQVGQVLMSQANQELPQGVREALGDGPEVRAVHETSKAGAGMAEKPQHHVLPKEHREWFEKRGFTSEMSIDQFCVELDVAHHQAVHGGGNWRLGRAWPKEWNQMIMKALRDAETEVGRRLTRNEILDITAERMKDYNIPMNFTPWRGR
jgi:hypothetical protein